MILAWFLLAVGAGVAHLDVVYEAANLIDAHLFRIALEHVGTPAFVCGEALLGGVGELPPCRVLTVCVPGDRWPEARSLVAHAVQAPVERPWPHGALST